MLGIAVFAVLGIALSAVGAYTILSLAETTANLRNAQEAVAQIDEIEAELRSMMVRPTPTAALVPPVGDAASEPGFTILPDGMAVDRYTQAGDPIIYCPVTTVAAPTGGTVAVNSGQGAFSYDLTVITPADATFGSRLGGRSYPVADDFFENAGVSMSRAAVAVADRVRAFLIVPGSRSQSAELSCAQIEAAPGGGYRMANRAGRVHPIREETATEARTVIAGARWERFVDVTANISAACQADAVGCGLSAGDPISLTQALAQWDEQRPDAATIHVLGDQTATLAGSIAEDGRGGRIRLIGTGQPSIALTAVGGVALDLPVDLHIDGIDINSTGAIEVVSGYDMTLQDGTVFADITVQAGSKLTAESVIMHEAAPADPDLLAFFAVNGRFPVLRLSPSADAKVRYLFAHTAQIGEGATLRGIADENGDFTVTSVFVARSGSSVELSVENRQSSTAAGITLGSPEFAGADVNIFASRHRTGTAATHATCVADPSGDVALQPFVGLIGTEMNVTGDGCIVARVLAMNSIGFVGLGSSLGSPLNGYLGDADLSASGTAFALLSSTLTFTNTILDDPAGLDVRDGWVPFFGFFPGVEGPVFMTGGGGVSLVEPADAGGVNRPVVLNRAYVLSPAAEFLTIAGSKLEVSSQGTVNQMVQIGSGGALHADGGATLQGVGFDNGSGRVTGDDTATATSITCTGLTTANLNPVPDLIETGLYTEANLLGANWSNPDECDAGVPLGECAVDWIGPLASNLITEATNRGAERRLMRSWTGNNDC